MRIIACDHCRSSEAPASEITATVNRRIKGRKGAGEPIVKTQPAELCEACAERFGLAVANLAVAVREGRATLPELPGTDDGGTVDLTQADGAASSAEPEAPESLPLNPADQQAEEHPPGGRKRGTG